jgi:hypothetical protein
MATVRADWRKSDFEQLERTFPGHDLVVDGRTVPISQVSSFHQLFSYTPAPASHKKPGDPIQLFRNQGMREGVVLAVIGDKILVEYEMPNGSTSLNIILQQNADKPEWGGKTVAYKSIPRKWLQAIVDAGMDWEGHGQCHYRQHTRGVGRHKVVTREECDIPSASTMLTQMRK